MTIKQLCEACKTADDREVQSIMDTGSVDVNSFYKGFTPLHTAMHNNHPSVVTILLSSDQTRLEVTTRNGWTALHSACYNNSE